jgi:hypothetical protein
MSHQQWRYPNHFLSSVPICTSLSSSTLYQYSVQYITVHGAPKQNACNSRGFFSPSAWFARLVLGYKLVLIPYLTTLVTSDLQGLIFLFQTINHQVQRFVEPSVPRNLAQKLRIISLFLIETVELNIRCHF